MRMPVLAIAILLCGGGAAFADDVSPMPIPDVQSPSPPPARPPVKIIDAAPAAKSDQAAPALPAPPPAVSSQAKTPPDHPADDAGNRFNFVHVDDGFLRFDLKTGQVAYCNRHSDGWSCQAVPENRSALEREVARLKDEVAALKGQIDSLREPPPPPRPPAPIPAPSAPSNAPPVQGDMTRQAPGHDDIARARAALHDVWQRLVEAIVGFKNDVMRKS